MFFVKGRFVYDRAMGDLTAFVLAGGQSSRMGSDKAFLELEGRTLLSRMLALAKTVASDVRILGDKQRFGAYGDVVEDEFPNHGPLGGIHAGLRASATHLNLILAVDMPFVEIRFLQYLVNEATRSDSAVVTLARAAGGWQLLCAVYRKPFGDLAEQALREGKNKIDPLFSQVQLRILEEAELEQQGFSPKMFRNLNTPEELRLAIES
jgi:molybdenum cofactor guanylyltransferase